MRPVTTKNVHQRLNRYFKKRQDIGALNGILQIALKPCSPFDCNARRRSRPEAGLFCVVAVLLVIAFVYFNFF
jgi:hypothetical protein